jgi:DNA-binding NtrC family response regulator
MVVAKAHNLCARLSADVLPTVAAALCYDHVVPPSRDVVETGAGARTSSTVVGVKARGFEGLVLRVVGDGSVERHPLPPSGQLVLGRARDADVQVDHSSVSRRHAILHLGERLFLEDLGSANGTTLCGVALSAGKPVEVQPGEVIDLGSMAMFVESESATREGADERPADAMEQIRRLVERVAKGTISVLLLGETGVGKEVFAELIHAQSRRADRPLLRLNCAALSETLLESELFGHERGAFTGALQAKPGLLETAQGGTVFLDEVGELPASTQVKLLRVLEHRQVTRVGGLKPLTIDVRFLSATNRDLKAEMARGTFRQDLYFRLNGISIQIPPLRERPGELDELTRQLLAVAAEQAGLETTPMLSPAALAWMRAYSWPGNIRELRNLVERAVLLCGDDMIRVEHLSVEDALAARQPARTTTSATGRGALKHELEALEEQRMRDALGRCAGNQSEAARVLGMSRTTFVARMSTYGLPRPRKKPKRS